MPRARRDLNPTKSSSSYDGGLFLSTCIFSPAWDPLFNAVNQYITKRHAFYLESDWGIPVMHIMVEKLFSLERSRDIIATLTMTVI